MREESGAADGAVAEGRPHSTAQLGQEGGEGGPAVHLIAFQVMTL